MLILKFTEGGYFIKTHKLLRHDTVSKQVELDI